MEKYDNEWLKEIYLRGVYERAIKRVSEDERWREPQKGRTIRQLRRELRMTNARLAKVASPAA